VRRSNTVACCVSLTPLEIPAVDEFLRNNRFTVQTPENAHRLLRLARISRDTAAARQAWSQYAHREATYTLHLWQEQLNKADRDLSGVEMGVGRLRAFIQRAGFPLDFADHEDIAPVQDVADEEDESTTYSRI